MSGKLILPILYIQKAAHERMWECWVEGNTIIRRDGIVTGKIKDPQRKTYAGNTLRTPEEQAALEAEKLWIRQLDKGYKPKSSDDEGMKLYDYVMEQKQMNGGMNRGVRMFGKSEVKTDTTAGNMTIKHKCMLAKKYKDGLKLSVPAQKLTFPVIVQPKLDGIRVLASVKDGNVTLESRNGKSFMHLNHIREEILAQLKKKDTPNMVLDGELYVHSLYRTSDGHLGYDINGKELTSVERYQFISESCKITRKEPHRFETIVEYWIFDIWDTTKNNLERTRQVTDFFREYDGDILKFVPTEFANSHEEIESYMKKMIGYPDRIGYEYEGVMIRDINATYKSSTTHQSCLLKYKKFQDEEWEIIGAERCNGGLVNGAIKWCCKKVVNGKELQLVAKQTGDTGQSIKCYEEYQKASSKFIGKLINIRFNEKTKDGVPRFPRATSIVEDK